MQKITPFLWFDSAAEEAAEFYVSLFPRSKILNIARYSDVGPGPKGQVMTVAFELDGEKFIALNGGPRFKFTEAISFVVNCETQAEIDDLWGKLLKGGEPQACGWLKDRYGLSWQIVPSILGKLMEDKDPERSKRVMQVVLQSIKFDIQALKDAHEGVASPR
jgi:predicted 3-demethylubiquinone-9 3-methyltransferase (glyoxalase superfamily)